MRNAEPDVRRLRRSACSNRSVRSTVRTRAGYTHPPRHLKEGNPTGVTLLTLNCLFSFLFRANPYRFFDFGYKDLSIADFAGFCGFDNRADGRFDLVI
jgi:hypothetical protein